MLGAVVEISQHEILLALAATGINLTPGAFRTLMAVPEPRDAINQLVVNYFTSKFARKTLSEEDVTEILNLPAQLPSSLAPPPAGLKPTKSTQTARGKGSLDVLVGKRSPPPPTASAPPIPPVVVPAPRSDVVPPLLVNSNSAVETDAFQVEEILPVSEINVQKFNVSEKILPRGEVSGGINDWHPTAREYATDVNVMSDPTRDLHTTGEMEDFLKVFQSRYEKLRKILLQHSDVGDAVPISEVRGQRTEGDVKVIGMVTDKRQTKTRNMLLELEDPTGRITVLVSQNKGEIYNLVGKIMLDQVICISGKLKINEGKSRIIFVEEFFWPDVPMTFRPNHAHDRVSAMFVSDMHVGSKEFMRPLWDRLVDFLNGHLGGDRQKQLAGEVKYLLIAGDAVDGIGIYPSQEENLTPGLDDIHNQYAVVQEMLQGVPEYIQIIYIPGNHEPVRNAIPMPAVPKKYSGELQDNLKVMCLGNPSMVAIHGVKTLMFHGDSFIDFSMNVPGVDVNHPETAMVECLRGRHLAPSFGKKTELAPAPFDWLVVDEIPDIFHTGHLHINGYGRYRNISCIGSGCFESQTDFMKSLGIMPTPGKPFIVRLYEPDLTVTQLDLQDIS